MERLELHNVIDMNTIERIEEVHNDFYNNSGIESFEENLDKIIEEICNKHNIVSENHRKIIEKFAYTFDADCSRYKTFISKVKGIAS